MKIRIKNGFILRRVIEENIVVPVGENFSAFNGMIVLNEVSAFIFEQMSDYISEDDLLERILDEFDVDKERAKADLDKLFESWHNAGLLEEAE